MNTTTLFRSSGLTLVVALALSACGSSNTNTASGSATAGAVALSGEIIADGSSTVQPLTAVAAELFGAENRDVKISVATSGTGGGFTKFCQGSTDISNASRPIKAAEKGACEKAGITFTELRVATDALTVVASRDKAFLSCVTVAELKRIWEPAAENTITTWRQVNPAWPNEPMQLYGPGTDSGTFDYFTGEINGAEGASRSDYNAAEDDNVIVQGVSGSRQAMGYLGYTYFEENQDKLRAVQVDGGKGCVTPSADTAANGTYVPLSRPLFLYVNKKAYTGKPQVKAFIDFYVAQDEEIAQTAQFIALNEQQKADLTKAAAAIGS